MSTQGQSSFTDAARVQPCSDGRRARRRRVGVAGVLLALAAATVGVTVAGPVNPAAALSTALGGDYTTTYATAGAVTVHVSGNNYSVSVKTPFRVEGATCDLPVAAVIATFSGAGPHFTGAHFAFNATTCLATGGAGGITVDLNNDGSVSLGSLTGVHLLTKTADAAVVAAPAVGGDYTTQYGTAGSVTVHVSGNNYTVSVKTSLTVENGSCALPPASVLATFSGPGPRFTGAHFAFNATTCLATGGAGGITADLNNDNSITLGTLFGPHLLTKIAGFSPLDDVGFTSLQPARVLETRAGLPTVDGLFDGGGAVGGGATLDLTVVGRGGVPATGVGAVVLNVTATGPTASGFVTVYPTGGGRPTASNLNFVAGQTTPNLVIAKVGDGGKVSLFNFAGSTDLIADVVGWFPNTAVSPAIGDYSTQYATAGQVTVHASGNTFTVSVKTPFQIEGATCALPVGSVLATFSGTGPHFSGGHFAFSSTTCLPTGGEGGISVFVNSDRTITLGTLFGPHLLTPL